MMDVVVYVSLQQSDLHCISAFESIRHSLGFTPLKGLRRYRQLRVAVDSASMDSAESEVRRFIGAAFDIVNPNKESVVFGKLDVAPIPGHVGIGFEVAAMDDSLRAITAPSMVQFPMIRSIDQRLMWVLILESNGTDEAALIQAAQMHCGPTRSRTQGLLVNPLFETYSVSRLF